MSVRELMTKTVISIAPEESAALAARLLSRHDLGALPVCDRKGRLLGIVTDRDIVTRCVAAGEDPRRVPVAEVMTRGVAVTDPEDEPIRAVRQMAHSQVRRLPVLENGVVVGMLSLGDFARHHRYAMECAEALSDISSSVRRD